MRCPSRTRSNLKAPHFFFSFDALLGLPSKINHFLVCLIHSSVKWARGRFSIDCWRRIFAKDVRPSLWLTAETRIVFILLVNTGRVMLHYPFDLIFLHLFLLFFIIILFFFFFSGWLSPCCTPVVLSTQQHTAAAYQLNQSTGGGGGAFIINYHV